LLRARHSRNIRFDTLFVPFHWAAANRLTNDSLDPASHIPEFKICAARAEPAPTDLSHPPAT
jgi:assimilatory nitrate reductase catalytic subunit